jgi:hypothetical protein
LRANHEKYRDRPAIVDAAAKRFGLDRHYVQCIATKAIPSAMVSFEHLYTSSTRGIEGLMRTFDRAAKLDEVIRAELARLGSGNKWILDEHFRIVCHGDTVGWKAARERWAGHMFEVRTSRGTKPAWGYTREFARKAAVRLSKIGMGGAFNGQ